MKVNNYKRVMNLAGICFLGILPLLVTACNEIMEDSLRYDYPAPGSNYESGHVLLVVVDDAAGRIVQAARDVYKAPNLKSMIAHALYTDHGLTGGSNNVAGGEVTNVRGRANLMIGNTTHDIKTEDDLIAGTDNFISRLVEENSLVSMYAIDEKFRQTSTVKGMTALEVNTDGAVKNEVLEELKLSDASDLIVAEFDGIREAAGGGFYNKNGIPTEAVVNAIGVLDNYINEVWSALKERPDYENENWLIIVTSNYGRDVQTVEGKEFAGHYADVSRNTFTSIYNERLVSQIQAAPGNMALSYSFSVPAWSYDYRNPNPNRYAESTRLGNTEMGEFYLSDKSEIEPVTIQLFLSSSVYNFRKYVILSKSSNMGEETKVGNGWFFHFNADTNNRRICFGFGGKRWLIQTKGENNLDWSQWHVLTLALEPNPDPKKPANALLTIYINGELNNQLSYKNSKIANGYTQNKSFPSTDASLRIGGMENRDSQNSQQNTKNQQPSNYIYVTNLQIYDVVIPKENVALYASKNQLHLLEDSYKYWDNLKGYWPCDLEDDQMEPTLKNYAKDNGEDATDDFVIGRGATDVWLSGSSLSPAIHPTPESDKTFYVKTFSIVDVPRQIFVWPGKNARWNWAMEGKARKFAYEEF